MGGYVAGAHAPLATPLAVETVERAAAHIVLGVGHEDVAGLGMKGYSVGYGDVALRTVGDEVVGHHLFFNKFSISPFFFFPSLKEWGNSLNSPPPKNKLSPPETNHIPKTHFYPPPYLSSRDSGKIGCGEPVEVYRARPGAAIWTASVIRTAFAQGRSGNAGARGQHPDYQRLDGLLPPLPSAGGFADLREYKGAH